MTNTMTYKGYTARVEYDPRDDIFVGRVLGIQDRITFHGGRLPSCDAIFALPWITTWPIVAHAAGPQRSPIPARSCSGCPPRSMPAPQ